MAKSVNNDVLDACHDETALANIQTVCAGEPTTRTEAVTTFALADVAMVAGDGNDYTIADGDVSGRKVTVAAKNGVTVDANGTADHIALCDATRLLRVTTLTTNQPLIAGNTVNIPAWDVEIADPT